MGAPVLTSATILRCAHGSPALAATSNARVTASGVPVLCTGDTALVQSCTAQPPCAALRLTGATRVTVSGQPLAIATGARSFPNGTHAIVAATQTRVIAT
jgi:uncharacterized Zn-binding protein involved in type VI secretion